MLCDPRPPSPPVAQAFYRHGWGQAADPKDTNTSVQPAGGESRSGRPSQSSVQCGEPRHHDLLSCVRVRLCVCACCVPCVCVWTHPSPLPPVTDPSHLPLPCTWLALCTSPPIVDQGTGRGADGRIRRGAPPPFRRLRALPLRPTCAHLPTCHH